MYTNLLYFIPVLLVYAIYSPPEELPASPGETLVSFGMLLILFILYNAITFRRLAKPADTPYWERQRSSAHAGAIHRNTIFAIILYVLSVYLLNLKAYILMLPFAGRSHLLSNLLGVLPFLFLLCLIWIAAHPTYQRFFRTEITPRDYVASNLRLNVPVLIPWLLFSLLVDLFSLLPFNFVEAAGKHPLNSLLTFSSFLILLGIFFPYLLVKVWRCPPLPEGPTRASLVEFCQKHNFECRNIVLWTLFGGNLMTAGVVGLVKRFRYVLISPALLDHLSGEELKAVMAHEMGHVKKRHLVFYVVFMIGYLLLAYSFFDLVFLMLFSFDSTLDLLASSKEEAGNALSLITTVPPLLFMFVYFRYLFGLFSRNFERQADLYAFKLTGSPQGLINSLKTLTRLSGRSEDAPSWHHHSISERIRFLRRCEENPSLVAKHNRKVSTLVLSFLIVILGSAYFGYFLNRSTFGQSLGTNFAQKFLEKRAEKEPRNASVHFALANILFERKDFPGAEAAYRRTLSITPLNPDALNNLAWLYATSPDPRFKKPKEALRLAQVAAYLSTAPHILDTLAESYFINGKLDAAIEGIKQAINQKPQNIEYYQEQLEKFMSAKRKDGGKSKGRGERLDKALRVTSYGLKL